MVSVGPQEIGIEIVQNLAPGTVGTAATAVEVGLTLVATTFPPHGRAGSIAGNFFPVTDAIEVSEAVGKLIVMKTVEKDID